MGKNTRKLAAGALAAGAIGYLAGVLTAPKSGKETREDIKVAANKAMREAEQKLKAVLSSLNTRLADARVVSLKLKGKAKDELDEVIKTATVAKDKVREVLSSLHNGEADDPELKKALSDAKKALKHLETYIKK